MREGEVSFYGVDDGMGLCEVSGPGWGREAGYFSGKCAW